MRVFLTGGTGFIGQPLTRTLLARGWNVTVLVRNPNSPQAQVLTRMGAQLTVGDITKCETMFTPMKDADIVVHNAGHYEYGMDKSGRERMLAINIKGTDNVLGLAFELGIPRTVYVSTVQAFGETGLLPRDETFTRQAPCRTAYEQSKTEAHMMALEYQQRGLPLVIVCPSAVIGVNDYSSWGYFMRMYINHVMPPLGWSPDAIHGCVDVKDVAEGIALAAGRGRIGEMYILSGEARPLREQTNYWLKRPGALKPFIWLPGKLAATLFMPMAPLQRMLGLPAFISSETVMGASTNWYYTSEKAKRELGWTHLSTEEMWLKTIDAEMELLSKRKGQTLLQRLKPLDVVE